MGCRRLLLLRRGKFRTLLLLDKIIEMDWVAPLRYVSKLSMHTVFLPLFWLWAIALDLKLWDIEYHWVTSWVLLLGLDYDYVVGILKRVTEIWIYLRTVHTDAVIIAEVVYIKKVFSLINHLYSLGWVILYSLD